MKKNKNSKLLAGEAAGDWVVFCPADVVLHPQLLGLFFRELHQGHAADLLFCHHIEANEAVTVCENFVSKPPFHLSMVLRGDYVGPVFAVRKSLVGEWLNAGHETAGTYDLLLDLGKRSVKSRSLPLFGYFVRGEGRFASAETAATAERFLQQSGESEAQVKYPGSRRRLHVVKHQPEAARLLVIVPYKDNAGLTQKCLSSLSRQKSDHQVTIALVDNESEQGDTARVMATRTSIWVRWQGFITNPRPGQWPVKTGNFIICIGNFPWSYNRRDSSG